MRNSPRPLTHCFRGFTACGLRNFFAAFCLYARNAALCQNSFSKMPKIFSDIPPLHSSVDKA